MRYKGNARATLVIVNQEASKPGYKSLILKIIFDKVFPEMLIKTLCKINRLCQSQNSSQL